MWSPGCQGVARPCKDIKIILMTRTIMAFMVILTLMWILMTITMMTLMVILTLMLILMTEPPGKEQHSNSRPVLPMLEVRSVKPW